MLFLENVAQDKEKVGLKRQQLMLFIALLVVLVVFLFPVILEIFVY